MRCRPLLMLSAAQVSTISLIFLTEAVKPVVGAAATYPVEGQLSTNHRYPKGDLAFAQNLRTPVVQDTADSHVHEEREGPIHTKEHTFWPPDRGNGLVAWIFAALFILMIASVPLWLHCGRVNAKFSWIIVVEGLCLLVWLICGLLCFTQLIEFQSPHFGNDIRTLTLVEAVYLFAQILTTVGYGDITPAYAGGQAIVACFVFISIILIAELISELSNIVLERAEKHVAEALEQASARLGQSGRDNSGVIGAGGAKSTMSQMRAMMVSILLFSAMVIIGTCFYHLYPGEGKTWGQGIYMSIITLTTVGFGAFTAETEAGKVFGSFWMVLGVMSLGYVVTSFTELMIAMREKDAGHQAKYDEAADDVLHMECVDHQGRVDQLGYLRYALLKYHIAPRDEIDSILKQFKALDRDNRGSISVELVKQLSVHSPHHHSPHHAHHGGHHGLIHGSHHEP